MKFPIMLRSTHEEEVEYFKNEIDRRNEWYMDLTNEFQDAKSIIRTLDNRNCDLNKERVSLEKKSNEYQDWYKNLTFLYRDSQNILSEKEREIQELKRSLATLEKKNDALKKINENDKKEMEKTYWCLEECKKDNLKLIQRITANDIAKDQLRDLCVFDITETEVLVREKVSGKKVYDLTKLLG